VFYITVYTRIWANYLSNYPIYLFADTKYKGEQAKYSVY